MKKYVLAEIINRRNELECRREALGLSDEETQKLKTLESVIKGANWSTEVNVHEGLMED